MMHGLIMCSLFYLFTLASVDHMSRIVEATTIEIISILFITLLSITNPTPLKNNLVLEICMERVYTQHIYANKISA
jgi:hypothetical protein